MEGEDLGEAILDSIRESVAVLDPLGRVKWANGPWLAAREEEGRDTVAAVAMGRSYLDVARESAGHSARVIADGVEAVLQGESAYFELEYQLHQGEDRWFSLSAVPLRGLRGAVVTQREVGVRAGGVREGVVSVVEEELTPRERDVLELLARGHDNRAIAAELSIGYTTVRGHVRSLIAKFGARSRLELVAHAYQRGMVSRPR